MTPEYADMLREEINKNFRKASENIACAIANLGEAVADIDAIYGETENSETKNWIRYIAKLGAIFDGCKIMEKNYAKKEKI